MDQLHKLNNAHSKQINGGDLEFADSYNHIENSNSFKDTLVDENPELEKYDLKNNKGYGTKNHIEAIKEHGLTKWHRKTFGLCRNYK